MVNSVPHPEMGMFLSTMLVRDKETGGEDFLSIAYVDQDTGKTWYGVPIVGRPKSDGVLRQPKELREPCVPRYRVVVTLKKIERRFFKVSGRDRDLGPEQVRIIEMFVPITGSYHEMRSHAFNQMKSIGFTATQLLDHSTKRECL